MKLLRAGLLAAVSASSVEAALIAPGGANSQWGCTQANNQSVELYSAKCNEVAYASSDWAASHAYYSFAVYTVAIWFFYGLREQVLRFIRHAKTYA